MAKHLPSLKPASWSIRISTSEFGGDTNIQSVARANEMRQLHKATGIPIPTTQEQLCTFFTESLSVSTALSLLLAGSPSFLKTVS